MSGVQGLLMVMSTVSVSCLPLIDTICAQVRGISKTIARAEDNGRDLLTLSLLEFRGLLELPNDLREAQAHMIS